MDFTQHEHDTRHKAWMKPLMSTELCGHVWLCFSNICQQYPTTEWPDFHSVITIVQKREPIRYNVIEDKKVSCNWTRQLLGWKRLHDTSKAFKKCKIMQNLRILEPKINPVKTYENRKKIEFFHTSLLTLSLGCCLLQPFNYLHIAHLLPTHLFIVENSKVYPMCRINQYDFCENFKTWWHAWPKQLHGAQETKGKEPWDLFWQSTTQLKLLLPSTSDATLPLDITISITSILPLTLLH